MSLRLSVFIDFQRLILSILRTLPGRLEGDIVGSWLGFGQLLAYVVIEYLFFVAKFFGADSSENFSILSYVAYLGGMV